MDHLALRAHRNLMAVSAWYGEEEGGATQWRDGELFFAARSPLPWFNGAMRELPGDDTAGFLERARSFFAGRERGFLVFAHPGDPELGPAAEAAGFVEVMERYPEMACRGPLAPLPGDVRLVEDLDAAATYWRICDAAYPSVGLPPGLFSRFFDPAALLPSERTEACVGYLDGEPVACASTYMAEGVGMVGWVAALPAARGRGLAAACTVWATNRAFAMGGELAALQASPMGEPIYERLGYEELFAYRLLGLMPG
ncbi:MAG: GCN5-related N-acetyltransferase [Solirubrobacterales bacterium]|nr:GCN5-related N-acetyltransferase [Solirubrobacterales bacterium]